MNGVRIESAYYGDETWAADVTTSLAKKVSGGVLNVTVEPSLIPTFEAAPVVRLNDGDVKRIEENAVKACGGTADQACLERTRIRLTDEKLRSRAAPTQANTVMTGKRLTVTILDGVTRRTLVTPEGQVFRLENVLGDVKSATTFPTVSKLQEDILIFLGSVAGAFFWAFSIIAVYTIFMRKAGAARGSLNPDIKATAARLTLMAYGLTALAALVPGSGYLIIFFTSSIPAGVTEYLAK